jgi:hypothetical protein
LALYRGDRRLNLIDFYQMLVSGRNSADLLTRFRQLDRIKDHNHRIVAQVNAFDEPTVQ